MEKENRTTTDEEYEEDELHLDPRPECPECMVAKLRWDGTRFHCPECLGSFGLVEVWNWHRDGKRCVICGASRGVHLGTVIACFHNEKSQVTLQYPICEDCAIKGIDYILERVQEEDYYNTLVEGGFEIGPHPSANAEHQGGLLIYV